MVVEFKILLIVVCSWVSPLLLSQNIDTVYFQGFEEEVIESMSHPEITKLHSFKSGNSFFHAANYSK